MADKPDMAKKKKSKVDFDFSDIAGKTTQVESIEAAKDILQDPKVKDPKKVEEKPKPAQEKATGHVLAIPGGGGRWAMRDIADCTPEEFILWAKMYYPVVTAEPDRFRSVSNKIRAYQQIVAWHQSMMRRDVRTKMH
jgi:hypothetical protein